MSDTKNKIVQPVVLTVLVGIFLLSALSIPSNGVFTVDSSFRVLGTSLLLLIFGVSQCFSKSFKVGIYSIDIWWIILITYTGLSALWASDPNYALYGMFTTTILYFCYKAFESIDWESRKNQKLLFWVVLICLLTALSVELYLVRDFFVSKDTAPILDRKFLYAFGRNVHMQGGLIILMLPFIIFNKSPILRKLSPLLLIIAFISIYASESAHVTILLFFLMLVYIIKSIDLGKLNKIFRWGALIGAIGLIGLAAFSQKYIVDKPHVIKEFSQQNDRLLMWENSFKLFLEAPIGGHGKNNWELAYGKYGYNDYSVFKEAAFNQKRYLHPHNSIFSIISETGIVGLVIYAFIALIPFFQLFKKRKTITELEFAATIVLILYFLLTLIYGVAYNFFNNFQGLSIIAVISLAIISRKYNKEYPLVNVSKSIPQVLIVMGSFACLFYFSQNSKADQLLISAKRDFNRGLLKRAENKLAGISSFYKTSQIHSLHAQTFNKQGKYQPAIQELKAALAKDPYDPNLLYDLSNAYYKKGIYIIAIELGKKASELSTSYWKPKILVAKCEYFINQDEMTIKNLHDKLSKLKMSNSKFRTVENAKAKSVFYSRHKKYQRLLKELDKFILEQKIML